MLRPVLRSSTATEDGSNGKVHRYHLLLNPKDIYTNGAITAKMYDAVCAFDSPGHSLSLVPGPLIAGARGSLRSPGTGICGHSVPPHRGWWKLDAYPAWRPEGASPYSIL